MKLSWLICLGVAGVMLLVACIPATTNFDASAVEQKLKSGFSEVLSVEGKTDAVNEAAQGFSVSVTLDSAFVRPTCTGLVTQGLDDFLGLGV